MAGIEEGMKFYVRIWEFIKRILLPAIEKAYCPRSF